MQIDYVKDVELENPPFTVPRSIAGIPIDLTDINGRLYLCFNQVQRVLAANDVAVLRRHINAVLDKKSEDVNMAIDTMQYEIPAELSKILDSAFTADGDEAKIAENKATLEQYLASEDKDEIDFSDPSQTVALHVLAEMNESIRDEFAYLQIYQAKVDYRRTATRSNRPGSAGGLQKQKFYSIELFLMIVERMANTPRKIAIMDECRKIAVEYYDKGIVINHFAQSFDAKAAVYNPKRPHTFNYTQLRHDMADENNVLRELVMQCSDIYLSDGSINRQRVNKCISMMHNTAHVSIHGMTAKQVVYTRMNSDDPFFGQLTWEGKNAPRDRELKNACNFMRGQELYARTHQLRTAIGRIAMDLLDDENMDSHQMLKRFTMYCVSKHITYVSWEWENYPETAIHSIINIPSSHKLKKYIRDAINVYKENFPNRHTLKLKEQKDLSAAQETLYRVCAENLDLYDEGDQPEPFKF